MEVHPPEHPIHTWRDFFVHIATIVVGLLIAIGLEQSVEWVHHRHLVHTAHANLRAEAVLNESKFREDARSLDEARASLLNDLATLRAIQAHPATAPGKRLRTSWRWESFHESAYNTSRETGALALMPFQEVQDIDGVYRQQHYVDEAVATYYRSNYRIYEPLAGDRTLADLSPAEITETATHVSDTLSNIRLLQDLMRSLREDLHELAGG